ncbi:MAG: YbbR-like domain-containing protein [Deltaproteobacteria bacterium]|nr:YbbR-like domain-containing protein [Deltaproteobacteria bacterium]
MSAPTDRAARVKSALRSAILDDLSLKVLSFSVAVGIWAWLQSGQVVEQRARVSVRYLWPDQLGRVGEVPDSLSVTLSGPQGRLRALRDAGLSVDVDLRQSKEGPVTVDFAEQDLLGLPEGVSVLQLSPPAAELQLDRVRERKVRIRPTIIGEPAEGWQRGEVRVEPSTVTVRGPQSLVRELTEADTDIIDLAGARATRSLTVPLELPSTSLRADGVSSVQVTIEISPIIADRVFSEVPVIIDGAPGWVASVSKVRVKVVGPLKELQALSADQVKLLARLPAAVPVGEPVKLRWAAGQRSPQLELLHGGAVDQITVSAIDPDVIELRPGGG